MPHQTSNDARELTPKKTEPVRQCAVSRERHPQSMLLRFACSPDGEVAVDAAAKLPGRGVWLTPTRDTVDAALKRGVFKRAFERPLGPLDGLSDRVEAVLLKRCQSLLGLARRAGDVVTGFDQVRARLRQAKPGVLLEAADGQSDGRGKVLSLARALYGSVPVNGALNSAELGMAFGRDHVVHGLIERGAFAQKWGLDYARLTGFRVAPENNWFSGTARLQE